MKLAIVVCLLLTGCASPNGLVAFNGICGMVPQAQQDGVLYVRMVCQEGQ